MNATRTNHTAALRRPAMNTVLGALADHRTRYS